MKKARKALKRIADKDKFLKHAGLALAIGLFVGVLAALIRSAF